jgi:ribonuclease HI
MMDSVFSWVKAHVRIQGNEMADRLTKKAAMNDKEEVVYDKIPRN